MPEIRISVENGTAWITVAHEERLNALTPEMIVQLGAAADQVSADPAVRSVVLRGAGIKAFVSGGDISRFKDSQRDAATIAEGAKRRDKAFGAIAAIPKPVIAMIQGYCMGGGLALALLADIRFAAEGSTFAIPAARLGIAYGVGGVERLTRLVGPSNAADILFSARRMGAEEAQRMGLINRVVPADMLEAQVATYCARLAENAPISIEAAKFNIAQAQLPAAARDEAAMTRLAEKSANSADLIEGRTAFMEKRKPVFRGS